MTHAPVIHLVTQMRQVRGSEMHVLALRDLLSPVADVKVWSASRSVDPQLREMAHIRRILARVAPFPHGGTLVIVGSFFSLLPWTRFARPRRTILIHTTDEPEALEARLRELRHDQRPVELVFPSEKLRARSGHDGVVELSPINVEQFTPNGASSRRLRPFTVGRLSPDRPDKYADTDPVLYRRLAESGVRVSLVGATCMAESLLGVPGVEVMPEIPQRDAPRFLQSLDCFVYRTSVPESYGRVVAEAMACEVPVVVQSKSGISEHLTHGVTGFIADSDNEAFAIVQRLRADRALAERIGAAGGELVRRLQAEQEHAVRNYYLGQVDQAHPQQGDYLGRPASSPRSSAGCSSDTDSPSLDRVSAGAERGSSKAAGGRHP